MNIEELKKLAGVDKEQNSMGENISAIATAKAEYQRKHNIKENTTSNRARPSGSNCGSHSLGSLVKTQCLKTNKYSHNASQRIHRN